ncbi:MAG: hypothetical protein P9M15_01130, partial [Candidatus Electryoneaceae bacterium]|nr:hypothetical protein [Candidatus Electryoneaceae bacterium]
MQLDPGQKPTRFNGVRSWPLEPAFYETFRTDNRPELGLCFDKVTFREAMDPQAAYLLLDGLSTGGHKHYDGNSIPQLTQFDRIWLADNDYYKQPVKFHNSMLVFRDGASEQIPAYTQLLGAGETSTYGYSRSRVNGYAGADWDRTVIWLKALKAFVVLDKLTAVEPGDYQFRLLWHGVGTAEVTADGMLLRQKGPSLAVQIGRGPRLAYHDDKDLGTNWGGYAHADPVVRSLAAVATRTLRKEE